MKILGVGVDIIKNNRIRNSLKNNKLRSEYKNSPKLSFNNIKSLINF